MAIQNFDFVYKLDKSNDAAFGLGFMHVLSEGNVSSDKALKYFKIALGIESGLVCILYGSLPIDPVLHEHEPYLNLHKRISGLEAYQDIATYFVELRERAVCHEA